MIYLSLVRTTPIRVAANCSNYSEGRPWQMCFIVFFFLVGRVFVACQGQRWEVYMSVLCEICQAFGLELWV